MSASPEVPHRAVEVVIRLTGDSDAEIDSALHQIRTEMALRDGQIGPCVSGGYSSSWTITVERRPEQTHDKWYAELQEYLSKLRAELSAAKEPCHE